MFQTADQKYYQFFFIFHCRPNLVVTFCFHNMTMLRPKLFETKRGDTKVCDVYYLPWGKLTAPEKYDNGYRICGSRRVQPRLYST